MKMRIFIGSYTGSRRVCWGNDVGSKESVWARCW